MQSGNSTFRVDNNAPKGLSSRNSGRLCFTGAQTVGMEELYMVSYLRITLNCIYIHSGLNSMHPKFQINQSLCLPWLLWIVDL